MQNYNRPLANVRSFGRDPIAFLLSLQSEEPIVSFPMAHLRFHHVTGLAQIKQILVQDQKKFIKTPRAQHFTSLALGEGLVSTDREVWAQHRREANPVFQPQEVDTLIRSIHTEVAQALDSPGIVAQPLRLHPWMMQLTLKVICKITFGAYEATATERIESAMQTMIVEAYRRITAPFSWPLFIPTPSNLRFTQSRKQYDTLVKAMTHNAFARGGKESIALKYVPDQGTYPPDDRTIDKIAVALKTIIAAGHETTATTLAWLLYEISRHPEAEEAMRYELNQVDVEKLTQARDLLSQTPYTQLIIKETLRLYPPIWLMGRMATEAVTVGNQTFRTRDNVLISPFVVHRLASLWDHPDQFIPERFTHRSAVFTESAYFPFGLGPRQCVGGHLATVEMLIILAALYQRFEMKIHFREPMEYHPYITLRPSPTGLVHLRLRKRNV